MGINEGTDTVRSDQAEIGPEGGDGETALDGPPAADEPGGAGVVPEAGAGAGPGAAAAASDATPAAAQESAGADVKKKKDKGLGSSRGIETMFRTNYRVHQDLTSLADTKANIMISVNGLIIAITIPFVTSQMAGPITQAAWYEWLPPLAIVILLIGCVTALVYAVLAATPRVSNVPITLEDITRNKANILFFGHFVNLSMDEYVEGMRYLMTHQDHLYVNMVRDLYILGTVLDKKFRLLRISYTVFMFALVLGVGLFVLGFALDAIMLEPTGTLQGLPQ